jgi:hypothetical protein
VNLVLAGTPSPPVPPRPLSLPGLSALQAVAAAMHRLCIPLEEVCSIARQAVSGDKRPHALGSTVREFQSHTSVALLKKAPLPFPGAFHFASRICKFRFQENAPRVTSSLRYLSWKELQIKNFTSWKDVSGVTHVDGGWRIDSVERASCRRHLKAYGHLTCCFLSSPTPHN